MNSVRFRLPVEVAREPTVAPDAAALRFFRFTVSPAAAQVNGVVRRWRAQRMGERCLSCGTAVGQLHEPFCNRELCPFCGDFITTCECIFVVLGLSDSERVVVEEYIDDSVEPLRGINARWKLAVEAKGRVPF